LTGLLVLFQNQTTQIIAGFVITLVFSKLYSHVKPYQDPVLQHISDVAMGQVYFVFFLGTNELFSHVCVLRYLLALVMHTLCFRSFALIFGPLKSDYF
jgi:hypothetical protein